MEANLLVLPTVLAHHQKISTTLDPEIWWQRPALEAVTVRRFPRIVQEEIVELPSLTKLEWLKIT